ncbi:hypothetical protein TC41_3185 [Alicyclobacillus acidocaldarius subsp. acidocaldarius Tc-4-1]|uniref:Uncharacterized protein n=1 Tax=Alicyclobacillus acidocaldarius (strain Tc-4-1) TaxID=1048834 RepID=F8IDM3_ALIAT|nr:hypothetical protein TC41_3185 [Alicyclobacillus acidocaldarius subsp. acidocaldarius Tc-4-1]
MRTKSRRTRVAVGAVLFALIAVILLFFDLYRYVVLHWL